MGTPAPPLAPWLLDEAHTGTDSRRSALSPKRSSASRHLRDERRPVSMLVCVAIGGLLSSAVRSARWAALAGDSGAGHSLGGGDVGPGARRVGDGDGDVLLQPGVSGWVVGGAVLPAAPEDAA